MDSMDHSLPCLIDGMGSLTTLCDGEDLVIGITQCTLGSVSTIQLQQFSLNHHHRQEQSFISLLSSSSVLHFVFHPLHFPTFQFRCHHHHLLGLLHFELVLFMIEGSHLQINLGVEIQHLNMLMFGTISTTLCFIIA